MQTFLKKFKIFKKNWEFFVTALSVRVGIPMDGEQGGS
jgi:hypothetical protein